MKSDYKIAASVRSWNTERYILPHMMMLHSNPLLKKILLLQGKRPWKKYADEHGLSYEKDLSEELVRYFFPDVQVYTTDIDKHCAEALNEGLDLLRDYDFVLILDSDIFMTQRDWNRFLEFIQSNRPNTVYIDYKKTTVGYHYDLDHGLKTHNNTESAGISTKYRYDGLGDAIVPSKHIIDWEDWTLHHLKGWKGSAGTKEWIENKVPSGPNKVYAKDLEEEFGPWISMPDEIKEMFKKAEKMIEEYKKQ